nr:hypothetical protein [Micromonospora sp. DSM 115978]
PPDHVRDSLTGLLVPVGHHLDDPATDPSEWYEAGASTSELLVVPLVDGDEVYGIDLTRGAQKDDRHTPVPPRQPGTFVVLAHGGEGVVLGRHETLGEIRVPPERLVALVEAHWTPGSRQAVRLGVGRLLSGPGATSGAGFAELMRAELGVPVFATFQESPDFAVGRGWREAPVIVRGALEVDLGPDSDSDSDSVSGAGSDSDASSTGGHNVVEVRGLDLTGAGRPWDWLGQVGGAVLGAQRGGAFPVVAGALADGRVALLTGEQFTPTVPRDVARLIELEISEQGLDPASTRPELILLPIEDVPHDSAYQDRIQRFSTRTTDLVPLFAAGSAAG